MKKSAIKKIIAVLLALATLVFAGCQNKEPVNGDNPSENISQNDVVNQEENTQREETSDKDETKPTEKEETSKKDEEILGYIPEGPGVVDVKKPDIMDNTIDLKSVKLDKYGISNNYEIGVPYPTKLGCVYLVRDYCLEYGSKTFIFVTTRDKVMSIDTDCELTSDIKLNNSYEIALVNLDGEKGEEIVLNMFNGGNGGAGGHNSYIFKIYDSRIAEMKQPDEPNEENGFNFELKAPFKMVVTNEYSSDEFIVEMKGNEEHERFFDVNGNPRKEGVMPMLDSYFIFEPIELNDGSYGVRRVQYTWVASHANCAGFATTIIKYNKSKKQFETVNAWFSDSDYDDYGTGYSEYAYCDINEDGTKEIIIHTGQSEGDREYNIYTVSNKKLVYVGAIEGWHASLYDGKGTVTMAAGMSGEGSYYTYQMKNNRLKLVQKGEYTWDDTSSTLKNVGKEIKFKEY